MTNPSDPQPGPPRNEGCPFCPEGAHLWPDGCEHVIYTERRPGHWTPDVARMVERLDFLLSDWEDQRAHRVGTPWGDLVDRIPFWSDVPLNPAGDTPSGACFGSRRQT